MIGKTKLTGKRIAEIFFTRDPSIDQTWVCRCGKRRKITGTGYSNLLNHVKEKHPVEYQEAESGATVQESAQSSQNSTVTCFLWKPNTVKVHGWLSLITHNLLPFRTCENELFKPHVKYDTVSLETVEKYMDRLCSHL